MRPHVTPISCKVHDWNTRWRMSPLIDRTSSHVVCQDHSEGYCWLGAEYWILGRGGGGGEGYCWLGVEYWILGTRGGGDHSEGYC